MTDLLLSQEASAAVVTINRPRRHNALTFDMFRRLPALLETAAGLPGVRALVLRGAGQRSFSAGADITEFALVRADADQGAAYDDAVLAVEEAIAGFPHPTIAQIQGYCYGAGCGLALACDVRFAGPAARFAITPAKLGIVYPLRSTKRLVDLVGPSRAKIILMSGAELDARQALSFGLIDEIADDPPGAVAGFAALLASRSAITQHATRRIVQAILDGQSVDDDEQARLRAAALSGPDYAEGVRAFLERRPPRF